MRARSRESPDVLLAFARQRDEEPAKERARLRVLADANTRTFTASKLKQELAAASGTLKKRKRLRALADASAHTLTASKLKQELAVASEP